MNRSGDFSDVFTIAGARPPIAPGVGAGAAPAPMFAGITKPTTDMQAVRDGRRSTPLQYLVDLSTARSFAAGTALLLDIQGNVFHSDPLYDLAGASQAGIARVHYQDENINPVGTYFSVLPGSIYRIPFTRVAVENYAQPGKFLSIVYGIDIDLVPGESQQVQASILNNPLTVGGTLGSLAQKAIGGVNALEVAERGFVYGASFASITGLAVNTNEVILAPASNVSGVIVHAASISSSQVAAGSDSFVGLLAKASAPGTSIDGDVLLTNQVRGQTAAGMESANVVLGRPVFVAAGKGLYFRNGNSAAESGAYRSIQYTVLP